MGIQNINGYKAEGFDEPFDCEGYLQDSGVETCGHIAIVSVSDKETQCMDCLRKWDKQPGFVSDFPECDRG